jgi:ATP-dependent Lon protease
MGREKIPFRKARGQARDVQGSNEFGLRRCPSFGFAWQIRHSSGGLLLPVEMAVDRANKRGAEPVASQFDEDLPSGPGESAPSAPSSWPRPEPELAAISKEIFNAEAVERYVAESVRGTADRDARERLESTLELLRARGAFRLANNVSPSWRSDLQTISYRFRSFETVIDHFRGCCALSELEQRVIPVPPILLNGPPGIGKSMFADAIAAFLGTTCIRIGFDTAQANSALVGTADYWSNTQPGQIFQSLVHGDHANPVVLIDEVDKVTAARYDPINALLPLLEPTTARRFRDLSFPGIEIDASLITWICTSNDADGLPAAFLSRVLRFDIEEPTFDQSSATVQAIFGDLCAALPAATGCVALAPGAIKVLATMAPRTVKLRLQSAIALAVFRQHKIIEAADVEDAASRTGREIGFFPLDSGSRARL